MDANIVLNPDVKQKDPSQALVIAITHLSLFDKDEEQEVKPSSTDDEVLSAGLAFPFIKAIQRVNHKLVEKNPDETLLFDVILMCDIHIPENHSEIINSVKDYGLEISRFCFCNNDNFTTTLLSNNVKLFLSANKDDIVKAHQRGVPAALLHKSGSQEAQLKFLFTGNSLGFSEDMGSVKELVAVIGEMRRKFGLDDSPLCTCLVTQWSPRDVCVGALKTLRDWGLKVDETYCLAGAPQSAILDRIQPHVLYDYNLHSIGDPALS